MTTSTVRDAEGPQSNLYRALLWSLPPVAGLCLGLGLYTVFIDQAALYIISPEWYFPDDRLPSMRLLAPLGVAAAVLLWLACAAAVRSTGLFKDAMRGAAGGFAGFLGVPILYFLNGVSGQDATMWMAHALVFAVAFLAAWTVTVALAAGPGAIPAAGGTLSRRAVAVAVSFAALYFVVSAAIGLLQYRAVTITYSDTADFDEMLWRTLHGNFLATSCFRNSFFGQHIEFIHLLLLPTYLVWPGLPVMMVTLSAGLALGVVPVYLLAKRKLGSKAAAALFCGAYVFYAPMQYLDKQIISNTYLPEVFYVPLMLWAIWFLETRRNWMLLLFSFLVVSCKEDLALPVAMFGVILAVRRQWLWAIGFFAGGLAWFLISFTVLIPWFEGGRSHVLSPVYYGDWGTSTSEIVRNVFSHPVDAFAYAFEFKRISFVVMLLAPMAFLALLSPTMFVVFLPALASNALAAWPPSSQIFFHYHLSSTPWAIAGGIYGAANIMRLLPRFGRLWGTVSMAARPGLIAAFCGVLVFVSSVSEDVLYGKFPISLKFYNPKSAGYWRHLYVRKPRAKIFVEKVVPMIPREARVSASQCLNTRFTHHAACYEYPVGIGAADYVLVEEYEPIDAGPVWVLTKPADETLRIEGFERIFAEGGIYVFKRVAPKTGLTAMSVDRNG